MATHNISRAEQLLDSPNQAVDWQGQCVEVILGMIRRTPRTLACAGCLYDSSSPRGASCACTRADPVTPPARRREQWQHTIARRATARQPKPGF